MGARRGRSAAFRPARRRIIIGGQSAATYGTATYASTYGGAASPAVPSGSMSRSTMDPNAGEPGGLWILPPPEPAGNTITLSDAVGPGATPGRSAAETLVLTDTAGARASFSRSTVAAGDGSLWLPVPLQPANPVTFTDQAGTTPGLLRGAADAITLADGAAVAGLGNTRTAPTAFTLADSAVRLSARARTTVETIALVDAVARGARGGARALADGLGLVDAVTRLQVAARTVVDALTVADTALRGVPVGRGASDALPIFDTVRATGHGLVVADDLLRLADVVAGQGARVRSAQDQVALLDTLFAFRGDQARTAPTVITISDAAALSGRGRIVIDVVTLADTLGRGQPVLRPVVEGLAIVDVAGRVATSVPGAVDVLLIDDAIFGVFVPHRQPFFEAAGTVGRASHAIAGAIVT